MRVTCWLSEQFQRKKSDVQGVLQKRVSQAVVSEQVGSLIHKANFSYIVKAQEKLKEASYEKDGRNKKEDESLER